MFLQEKKLSIQQNIEQFYADLHRGSFDDLSELVSQLENLAQRARAIAQAGEQPQNNTERNELTHEQ